MQSTTLKIDGMTCGHCVSAVTAALQKVPGVVSAEVSLDKGQAVVKGDADAAVLIRAVEEEGYAAECES